MSFEHRIRVEFGDTDAAGIVYYPNFYKWMDEATHALFRVIDLPVSRLINEHATGIPLLETHCEFQAPAFFEDEIIIKAKIHEIRDKVFHIGYEFYRHDQRIAHGYCVRAWTSMAGPRIKAVSIPENVREQLKQFQNTDE